MSFRKCIGVAANVPRPRDSEDDKHIAHVQFRSTDRNDYEVKYEKIDRNLLTEFLEQSIGEEFHKKILKVTFRIDPSQDTNNFCKVMLETGIFWEQQSYFFLGNSENQLKKDSKSCFLLSASDNEIHHLLLQFGDFLGERSVAKRARKINMLFSTLNKTLKLDKSELKVEPDVKRGFFTTYSFTDGCGFMSPDFASQVHAVLKVGYQPSAVRVRYRGIEGMLVTKEDLSEVKVQFHHSMQKFFTADRKMPDKLNFLDVVDYSRPYQNGYLDSRMVMLLVDRGVPAQKLENIQEGFHELVDGICNETAEYFLHFKGEFELSRRIEEKGIDDQVRDSLQLLKKQELEEMKKAGYTRILVPNSRELFAVCDPYNKLKYGECYLNPTMTDDEAKSFPGPDRMLVAMAITSHHPGDVRLLRLTDDEKMYENLWDCLVLPVKGRRPHAFESGGANLGGTKFFVTWNEHLLPIKMKTPCDYPLERAGRIRKEISHLSSFLLWGFRLSPRKRNERGRKEMREYFASFTDDLTEKIEATYMKHATCFGPSSKKSQELNKIFYQAVNLLEHRSTLEKHLLKLEKMETPSSDCPKNPPQNEEKSPLLPNEQRGNLNERVLNQAIKQPRSFLRLLRRSPFPVYDIEVHENLHKRAKQFVERALSEFHG